MKERKTARRALLLAALCVLPLVRCANSETDPLSSESHFLGACATGCVSDLECVCGVCSRPCSDDAACGGLTSAACDVPPSACPATALCDVTCATASDCQALGSGFYCVEGRCRTTGQGDPGDASIEAARPDAAAAFDAALTPDAAAAHSFDVHGVITNMPQGESPRIALIWSPFYYADIGNFANGDFTPSPSANRVCPNAGPECSLEFVEQPATSRVDADGHFELEFSDKLPAAAFSKVAAGAESQGELVVYRDANHNGKFDFVGYGEAPSDELLGVSDPAAMNSFATYIPLAYSFFYQNGVSPRVRLERHTVTPDLEAETEQPITTSIPITLSQDPALQAVMCSSLCLDWSLNSPSACPERAADVPSGGIRACVPQPQTAYTWVLTVCDHCQCSRTECSYAQDPKLPPPPGWSCASP